MSTISDTYVIILAAGYATRLKPLSNRIPKPLIEVQGTPIITRIISSFKDAGFKKFCVLIGYKEEVIKKEVSKIHDIEVDFVEQKEISGMADAVLLCLTYLKEKIKSRIVSVFVTAADIIFSKKELNDIFSLFKNAKADIVLSLMKSIDIKIAEGHGNVKISEDSNLSKDSDIKQGLKITDIIEKPKKEQILSEYYSLPLYLFNQKIISYLGQVKKSERGERELQDAIKLAITSGDSVRGINIINSLINHENVGKYHLTYLKDILKMNARFLSGLKVDGYIGDYPTFLEPVFLKPGVEIGDTVLIGPNVVIDKGCKIGNFAEISNAVLYQNCVIGKKVKLTRCIVDENINLPENFQANECFITKNEKNNLDLINI